jgi:hypothetical protein
MDEQPIQDWYLIQRMGEDANAMLLIDSLRGKYEMKGAYFLLFERISSRYSAMTRALLASLVLHKKK